MSGVANISRYTLDGTPVCFQGGIDFNRLIIRVSATTRMSFSEGELGYNYLTLASGSVLILDPPNTLSGTDIWFDLDSAGSGVVEIVRS
jgi:hypothetical protein